MADVLPNDYVAVMGELQRLAGALDRHPAAVDRIGWWWYPEHRKRPPVATDGVYVILLDTAIVLFNSGHDRLELTLNVAWCSALTVNAAVEVACWCPQDHNMHQVRSESWTVDTSHDLADGFAAGTTMLTNVLDSGRFDPGAWRLTAGLPDAPPQAR
ncbi:hypothetical protein J2S43_001575 [Catenuloplanes nepalensis]|uniref:Uncharacterized protein n=1 Tax=Catenuloplanes nepalensis TaxID=587533 RepID=A0ABT9MNT7_9ACTN|nr:hypothetical protein [Catenuloplanes nepalensis]MDP9793063.1 hypothetical protein [Catenuloplanes nepalensis]